MGLLLMSEMGVWSELRKNERCGDGSTCAQHREYHSTVATRKRDRNKSICVLSPCSEDFV